MQTGPRDRRGCRLAPGVQALSPGALRMHPSRSPCDLEVLIAQHPATTPSIPSLAILHYMPSLPALSSFTTTTSYTHPHPTLPSTFPMPGLSGATDAVTRASQPGRGESYLRPSLSAATSPAKSSHLLRLRLRLLSVHRTTQQVMMHHA